MPKWKTVLFFCFLTPLSVPFPSRLRPLPPSPHQTALAATVLQARLRVGSRRMLDGIMSGGVSGLIKLDETGGEGSDGEFGVRKGEAVVVEAEGAAGLEGRFGKHGNQFMGIIRGGQGARVGRVEMDPPFGAIIIFQRMFEGKKRHDTVYYYDDMIGTYHYAVNHPMKPLRVAMTDEIVRKYGLDNDMQTIDNVFAEAMKLHADEKTLTTFHSDEYVEVISKVTPENRASFEDQLYRFNFKEDCPVMERLYEYVLSYTTGSVACAAMLGQEDYKYGINWSGGLHHAKQSEASGFCYINDCVLAILELLKYYQRVLYIDIDIHHGDGVEEAFYLTDRVMTCSFHKFKDYFPGTGHIDDIGKEKGINHSVNFPLDEGLDDESFRMIFEPVITKIMETFNPDAILLQGGADSLSGDRLGCFNLSVKGHGSAAEFVKKFNKPMLFFGGGGYTLRNVPRCWAYETSVVLGKEVPNEIPPNEYSVYFAPENCLHMSVSNMENQNSKGYLEKTRDQILRNLSTIGLPGHEQIRINQDAPVQTEIREVMRLRRDLWEQNNVDRNTDKND